MSLTRWDPVTDLVSLREAMNRLFEESFVRPRQWWAGDMRAPALDMYETKDSVVVKAAVPGVKPEEVDISITGDTLTISGEFEDESNVERDNYIRRERRFGAFQRNVPLPTSIDSANAEAQFENGILTITLPKAEETKPKTIKVKTVK